jgi:hypothetical protein
MKIILGHRLFFVEFFLSLIKPSCEIVDNTYESGRFDPGAASIAVPFHGHFADPASQPQFEDPHDSDDPRAFNRQVPPSVAFNYDPYSSSMHTYPDDSDCPITLLDHRQHTAFLFTRDSCSHPWAFDPFPTGDILAIGAPQPYCEEWVLGCPPLASGGDPYRDDWLLLRGRRPGIEGDQLRAMRRDVRVSATPCRNY